MTARRIAVAALAAVAVLLVVVLTRGDEDEAYTVNARIADAEGISKDFVVRVDGVKAGTVTDFGVDRNDIAWVAMELDREVGSIGVGARLSARAANLLGEKYLDLQTGDRARPVPSGSWIPLARTSSEVQLDDILNTLDTPTRMQLRILISEAGLGLSGRREDLNELLSQMPGTLRETNELLAQVNRDNQALGDLVDRGEAVVSPSAVQRRQAARLVGSFKDLMDTTASRREQLAQTVQRAPGTLGQLRRSLQELDGTARNLGPTAAQLRQAAPGLTQVLTGLPGFADEASGTLKTAQDVAPQLADLGRGATPDLQSITPTLTRLAGFAKAAAPTVESLGRGGVTSGLLHVMQNWTRTINQEDAIGHYFRLRLVYSETALRSIVGQLAPVNAPARAKKERGAAKPAAKPAPSQAPQAAPAAAARPQPVDLTPKVTELLDDVLQLTDLDKRTRELVERIKRTGEVTTAETKRLTDALKGTPLVEQLDQALPAPASAPSPAPASPASDPVAGLLDFLLG